MANIDSHVHSKGPGPSFGARQVQVQVASGTENQVHAQSQFPVNTTLSTLLQRPLPTTLTASDSLSTVTTTTTETSVHVQASSTNIPAPAIGAADTSLSITTTSSLTTSTDATIPKPLVSHTATTSSWTTQSSSSNHPAIIGGVTGAGLIVILIIISLIFIKRRRRAQKQRHLTGSGTDHQGGPSSGPGVSSHMTAAIPFQIPTMRGTSQHNMLHTHDKLLSHPRPISSEGHASMTWIEEMQNQVVGTRHGVELYPLSTERDETPNPFSDSAAAPESQTTHIPVSDGGPSPQFIDLIAGRVAEILRTQDRGIEAQSNVPIGSGGQTQFRRESSLSRSDSLKSSTAPPTYATDEE